MGVHVLDVLVRPVEAIPEGQGGQLVEEIRITAGGLRGRHRGDAGQARRRGAQRGRDRAPTRSGDMLRRPARARRHRHRRCSSAATTCRPRPACCRSARTATGRPSTSSAPTAPTAPTTSPWDAIAAADPPAPRRAGVHGRRGGGRRSSRTRASTAWSPPPTSSPRASPGLLEWIAPALRAARLPAAERRAGARAHRRRRPRGRLPRAASTRGVGCVAATCGADGVVIVDAEGARARCPRSRSRRSTPPAAATPSRPASCAASPSGATAREAAALGCAAAALVAQGLGTDHGDFDLAAVEQFAA